MSDITPTTQSGVDALRQRAEDAARLEHENADLRKQLAFAGSDLTNPAVKYVYDTYTGEMTPEAVKAVLAGFGIGAVPAPGTPPVPSPAPQPTGQVDPSFQQARHALNSDATPAGVPPERVRTDPFVTAMLNKQQGLREGRDPDVLLAQGVAVMMGAAKLGDERALIRTSRDGYADPREYQ